MESELEDLGEVGGLRSFFSVKRHRPGADECGDDPESASEVVHPAYTNPSNSLTIYTMQHRVRGIGFQLWYVRPEIVLLLLLPP